LVVVVRLVVVQSMGRVILEMGGWRKGG